jgi:AcrR family transcriptional regulator
VLTAELTRRGYDATSMEDLARASGLAKSALYHHVPSKAELLRRAVTPALDELTAVLDEPAATTGPAADRLAHVLRRSVAVLAARLPAVTLLLRVRGNTDVEAELLERRRLLDARLAALVQDAVDAGELRSDLDPRLVARLLFGTVNSLVEWWRPAGPDDPERVGDALVALVFGGLRA